MKKAISLFLILIVLSAGISIPNKAMAQEEPWCQISASSKVEFDGALRIDVTVTWGGASGADWNVLYIDGKEWTGWQGTDGTTATFTDWFSNSDHDLKVVINKFSGPQGECHKYIDPAKNGSISVPACGISIPSGSVVSQFTADTLLYWAPNPGATTEALVNAGQTAWTVGVSADGAYRKIVWSCQYLWVPIDTMGLNYDAVWNGTPLPMGTVQ
jgi:hypothetical protein